MADLDLEKLKLLFEYTKFHIGLYATLIGVCMALAKFGHKVDAVVLNKARFWLGFTAVCFLGAGAAGGAIASNIADRTPDEFFSKPLTIFGACTLTYNWWEHIEHGFFWVGVLVSVGYFIFQPKEQPPAGVSVQKPAAESTS